MPKSFLSFQLLHADYRLQAFTLRPSGLGLSFSGG